MAPLLHGARNLILEQEFDGEQWYRTIQDERVEVWYTSPTAIRMLMRLGPELASQFDLSSLRLVASVGEPLNPDAVGWGREVLGMPILDNWWQTETGGIMIGNLRDQEIRPGSMGRPLPGVEARIVRRRADGGLELLDEPNTEGEIALKEGWPSMMRTYLDQQERYEECFRDGWYLSDDLAMKDEDGFFWFLGRADDMIKSAGHRIGPFEIESVLTEHPAVAEAAAVGKPDSTAGEIVKAFVALKNDVEATDDLKKELLGVARKRLGSVSAPREIEFVDELPKNRSGKIVRRILRAKESGEAIGDTSTLERGSAFVSGGANSEERGETEAIEDSDEEERAAELETSDGTERVEAERALGFLRMMKLIRRFEEKSAELYADQKIRGFLHLYIGEEAVATGVMDALEEQDRIVATYREHGHALARGVPAGAAMAELMGRVDGCSGGRGGSMHLFHAPTNFYGGWAIVGGGLPIAVGLGLAAKMQGRPEVIACFFGEGAVAEGEFHEAMNLAALWELPVLFCCENNAYAMGTALARSESETDLCLKAAAYQVPAWPVDGMDVLAVAEAARKAVLSIRGGGGPVFLEFQTYRFRAHSMFDPELYRHKEEVERWRKHDPITRLVDTLRRQRDLDEVALSELDAEAERRVDEAIAFAEASETESPATLTRFLTSEETDP
jgi:pyruvate dehydrogenase E1 component alpha subunit